MWRLGDNEAEKDRVNALVLKCFDGYLKETGWRDPFEARGVGEIMDSLSDLSKEELSRLFYRVAQNKGLAISIAEQKTELKMVSGDSVIDVGGAPPQEADQAQDVTTPHYADGLLGGTM